MHGVSFRIFPLKNQWGWCTIDASGMTVSDGVAPSRAVAAALVIRDVVRVTLRSNRALEQVA